jgi:hypothetical protein
MSNYLAIALLVMLPLSACSSSAYLVRKQPFGGRVQLDGAYMPAMSAARMLMVEHCNGRYQARELGNAVEFECMAHSAQPVITGQPVLQASAIVQ